MSLADVNVTGDGGFRPHYSSDEGLTTEEALDIGFLLTCAIFTMSFQGGFALLESGEMSKPCRAVARDQWVPPPGMCSCVRV